MIGISQEDTVIKKLKMVPCLAAVILAGACTFHPGATPATAPVPINSPSGPGESPVAETESPSATSSPAVPDGFFPIAIGNSGYPESATLLGGTENGVWIDANAAAARLSGGEVYNLYSPTGLAGTAVGAKPVKDRICGKYMLQWDPPPSTTSLIGLGGGWDALPRSPEDPPISDFRIYTDAAGSYMTSLAFPVPDPLRLTRLVLADLEGDGPMEALISASQFSEDTLHIVAAGDFSMVLLFRETVPDTTLLAGDFYPDAKSLAFPKAYSILSILDLNGDGRMEVILHVSCWEGGGALVFALEGANILPVFDGVCAL